MNLNSFLLVWISDSMLNNRSGSGWYIDEIKKEEQRIKQWIGIYENASKSYNDKDYKKSSELFKEIAEPKSAKDQYNWGVFFFHKGDYDRAEFWLNKAAEQDYVDAKHVLGLMYLSVDGYKADAEKTISYLDQYASAKNDVTIMIILGCLYAGEIFKTRYNVSIEKNKEQAEKFFKRAINNNSLMAKVYLARLLIDDESTELENVKAYNLALEVTHDENAKKEELLAAYSILGTLHLKGQGTQRDFTAAIECFEKVMNEDNSNYSVAAYLLGVLYMFGLGTERDIDKSKEYFQIAAKKGNESAKSIVYEQEGYKAILKKTLEDYGITHIIVQ